MNLVPALAGVRLAPFVAATVLGIAPAALVYALAGRGLGSIIDMQLAAQSRCLARGESVCPLSFDARAILTPELITALVGLALLALLPVLVARLRRQRSVAE